MYHETTLRIEMENEVKANEAIEVVTKYISNMDDHNLNKLIDDLSVEENAVVAEGCPAFDEDTLYVIPELFKAIAQNDSTSDFKGTAYYENDYASFNCDVTFKEHTLAYRSEYFPEGDAYYCPDEDCYEFIATYSELIENETFTCPSCGNVYTADELAGERPEITDETWYIK